MKMVEHKALQNQLQHGNTGRILEAINNAEALIGRQEIKFPRIAVFGDESTGKSSLMEAICSVPFPRGELVTTRAATQVRLQRTSSPWSAIAWTAGQEGTPRRHQVTVKSPHELTQVISDLQKKEIDFANRNKPKGQEAQFTTVPITIEIRAENVVDLTLVDLPGFFQTTVLDKVQDRTKAALGASDVERVRTTLCDYLEDELTILLVVIPANANLKNANILRLIEDFKNDLDSDELENLKARTIYCFTKCDLVGTGNGMQRAPQNIEEVLSNKGDFAAQPHGWYAVVNNKSGSDDPHQRLKMDRQEEVKYFENTLPYTKASLRDRCGTAKLVAKLSSLLAIEISKRVPSMLSETSKALSLAKQELEELGPLPLQKRDLDSELNDVVNDIKLYFKQATNGTYGELRRKAENSAPDFPKERLKQLELGRLRKERFQTFKEEIRSMRLPLDSDGYLQRLHERISGAVDGKIDDVLPNKEVLLDEMRDCVESWKGLAERLCEDIARLAISCLHGIVDVRTDKYERLPNVLQGHLTGMIEEQMKRAQTRLRWHYVDEMVRPNTMTDSFLEAFHKNSVPGLGESDENNRSTYVAVLEALLPTVEARYIDNVVRTITTHTMDVPLGEPMTRVEADVAPKYVFSCGSVRGELALEELMKKRVDLEKKREVVSEKILELENLRAALLSQPAHATVANGHVNGKRKGEEANNHGGTE